MGKTLAGVGMVVFWILTLSVDWLLFAPALLMTYLFISDPVDDDGGFVG